jgi:hypothetical protein
LPDRFLFGPPNCGHIFGLWGRQHYYCCSASCSQGHSDHHELHSYERANRNFNHCDGHESYGCDFSFDWRRKRDDIYRDQCDERYGDGAGRRNDRQCCDYHAAGNCYVGKRLHCDGGGSDDCECLANQRTNRYERDADRHELHGCNEREVQRHDGKFYGDGRESHFHNGAEFGDNWTDSSDDTGGHGDFGKFIHGECGERSGPDD